jgi:methyltransferase (TIGR00027 family)
MNSESMDMDTPAGQSAGDSILQAGQPSRSALMVAMLRAAHQLLDEPKVFDDPLALRILGPVHEALVRQDPSTFDTGYAGMLRAAMAVRSRLAEDALRSATERGVTQYVVLGAGLDSFAYRNPAQALRVFEVDHPATQAWKRALLRESGIDVPDSLRFVPVDFEQDTLAEALCEAGCRLDQPVFFSWLGVTLYLTHEAIFSTLCFVTTLPKDSAIVFDYGVLPSLLTPRERMGMEYFAKKYAAQGEPWKSYFDPAMLADELHQTGFSELIDYAAADLRARYLTNRTGSLNIGGGTHLMLAWV